MREVMMPNVPAEALYYDSPYNQQMLNMEQQEFKNMASMMASNMTYDSSKKKPTKQLDIRSWPRNMGIRLHWPPKSLIYEMNLVKFRVKP